MFKYCKTREVLAFIGNLEKKYYYTELHVFFHIAQSLPHLDKKEEDFNN